MVSTERAEEIFHSGEATQDEIKLLAYRAMQEPLKVAQQTLHANLQYAGRLPNELQMKWREVQDHDFGYLEVALAVLDALITQGFIPAHDGDGVACVVQMIEAQWKRAEKYKKQARDLRLMISDFYTKSGDIR